MRYVSAATARRSWVAAQQTPCLASITSLSKVCDQPQELSAKVGRISMSDGSQRETRTSAHVQYTKDSSLLWKDFLKMRHIGPATLIGALSAGPRRSPLAPRARLAPRGAWHRGHGWHRGAPGTAGTAGTAGRGAG